MQQKIWMPVLHKENSATKSQLCLSEQKLSWNVVLLIPTSCGILPKATRPSPRPQRLSHIQSHFWNWLSPFGTVLAKAVLNITSKLPDSISGKNAHSGTHLITPWINHPTSCRNFLYLEAIKIGSQPTKKSTLASLSGGQPSVLAASTFSLPFILNKPTPFLWYYVSGDSFAINILTAMT